MTPEEWAAPISASWADEEPGRTIHRQFVETIRAAVAEHEAIVRPALGMKAGESLNEWLCRMQDECNRLREKAVAEERERCAKLADEWAKSNEDSQEDDGISACVTAGHIADAIRGEK